MGPSNVCVVLWVIPILRQQWPKEALLRWNRPSSWHCNRGENSAPIRLQSLENQAIGKPGLPVRSLLGVSFVQCPCLLNEAGATAIKETGNVKAKSQYRRCAPLRVFCSFFQPDCWRTRKEWGNPASFSK